MNTIILNNHQLTYHVIYQKKRKNLQLKILSSTHLEIIAPTRFPKAGVEQIIRGKSTWIIKKTQHLAAIAANPINKAIIHGATVLFLGQPCTLIFTNNHNAEPGTYLEDHQIFINTPLTSPKENTSLAEALLKEWYRDKASTQLATITSHWAAIMNVQPQRITIKEQKTRWGSCSSVGNLNYNWRIIMAPPAVIEYLVIHELCHLRIPNHSALFWDEVANYSPFFKQHRTWLKNNSRMLMDILTT